MRLGIFKDKLKEAEKLAENIEMIEGVLQCGHLKVTNGSCKSSDDKYKYYLPKNIEKTIKDELILEKNRLYEELQEFLK